ncbi:MAG: TrkA C-terminal domain-containing protein [Deltaproteobacteria bacterium]|nr:TrkA C-terminal domain-containing protein [Deltaproteobacteria bacterium]
MLEASLMDTYYVDEKCAVAGHTLAELDLRKHAGASIIAVIRKGVAKTNPHADFTIEPGDIMVLFGSHAELNAAQRVLEGEMPG